MTENHATRKKTKQTQTINNSCYIMQLLCCELIPDLFHLDTVINLNSIFVTVINKWPRSSDASRINKSTTHLVGQNSQMASVSDKDAETQKNIQQRCSAKWDRGWRRCTRQRTLNFRHRGEKKETKKRKKERHHGWLVVRARYFWHIPKNTDMFGKKHNHH